MEGIRSRTPLFSRHATPTRSNKKTTTTIAKTVISSTNIINASSPTPKTSSLCSLSICEGKNKRKMKKKENNESHHLSQQLTSASRSGANIKVRYTNKNNNFFPDIYSILIIHGNCNQNNNENNINKKSFKLY